MINYYKYLPTSTADAQWGLHVLNAGCNRIDKQSGYPSTAHPGHHYFNWENGRVLDEYQLIYIAKGEGTFESASGGSQSVRAGTVMILFPGEWHRFKPDNETGWDELWVGFKGDFMDHLVQQKFLNREQPVLTVGLRPAIFDLLMGIITQSRQELSGYQALVSGMVMHLLGEVYSATKQHVFIGQDATAAVMNEARELMRRHMEMNLPIETIARELNIGYAWFRKAFKNYTGIAPHQYLLQLRLEKAKVLLADASLPIKQIALLLNFESAAYFSKIFKKKHGVSPELYRKNQFNIPNIKN